MHKIKIRPSVDSIWIGFNACPRPSRDLGSQGAPLLRARSRAAATEERACWHFRAREKEAQEGFVRQEGKEERCISCCWADLQRMRLCHSFPVTQTQEVNKTNIFRDINIDIIETKRK